MWHLSEVDAGGSAGVPGNPANEHKGRLIRCAVALLLAHAGLLAWSGARHSPTFDEYGHLPAGIAVWLYGRVDLYRVNPPLVKVVAALPSVIGDARVDWSSYREAPAARPEWAIGEDFFRLNDDRAIQLFVWARWICIPLSLLGGLTCYWWASELYGPRAGLVALTLWSFCPTVLAWGSTITPDTGAAALGVLSCYRFWKWLREPTWLRAVWAGTLLGLAELTKMTWLVLPLLWPVLWLICGCNRRGGAGAFVRGGVQLIAQLAIALYVLNLGYGFQGSFKPLGQYRFVSAALSGLDVPRSGDSQSGNRFTGSCLEQIPVPLPTDYVCGADLQKFDFECKKWSYLNGEWRLGGWWYWYLWALAVKMPLGTIVLGALAVLSLAQSGLTRWHDDLAVLLPALVVVGVVSCETGFSRYVRYVLPAFPFAYVWISQAASFLTSKHTSARILVIAALLWSIASSLLVYPHSMSYFNELAGGPTNGHRVLIDANVDWGQDVLYLKEWSTKHPEARPLHVALYSLLDPQKFGIDCLPVPAGPNSELHDALPSYPPALLGPRPGWHVVSVHRLHDRNGQYRYLLEFFRPVTTVGYSLNVYHVTPDEANRVRRELGLPELPAVVPQLATTGEIGTDSW